ncbi:MAG: hypothetical protein EBU90_27375 [Proteobacteria bacterium]|nr:hypothetical protein [Pseudomonadota bacterium]
MNIGKLYCYPFDRKLSIWGEAVDTVKAKEPFVLLKQKGNIDVWTLYKVLTINGVVGWIRCRDYMLEEVKAA